MATCSVPGNGDMYGLGIRIGFYLQWFTTIIASWLAESEVPTVRLLNLLTVLAVSLALVICTSMNALSAADIYIVLLLVFGAYYYAIPLYLWRLVTGCHPNWDPSRWPRGSHSRASQVLSFVMFLVLVGYTMWFWCTGLQGMRKDCNQYGFFFAQIVLDSSGFIAWNIIFNLALLTGAIWAFCAATGLVKGQKRKKRRVRRVHIEAMQQLQSAFDLIVASIMVAAVELVVQWNNIRDVNSFSSAAQLIPTIISAGFLVRVLLVWMTRESSVAPVKEEQSSRTSTYSSTTSPSSRPPGPPAFGDAGNPDPTVAASSSLASSPAPEPGDRFQPMPPTAGVPPPAAAMPAPRQPPPMASVPRGGIPPFPPPAGAARVVPRAGGVPPVAPPLAGVPPWQPSR